MKRYLGIFIALVLTMSLPMGVFGDDNVVSSPIKLDLEQAFKMLEANNLEIKLLDKKIELQVEQNEDIKEAADDARSMHSTYENTNLQYRKTEKLSWRNAMLQLDSLHNDRAEKLKELKRSVKQLYVSLMLQQENINYLKQDIDVMNRRLEEVQLRIKLGQAKESDYKAMYSQSLSLQNQLNALNVQYENTMINLKKALGIDLSQPVEIQNIVLPYVTVDGSNIQSDIEKAVENDFSIEKLNREIEMKKLEIQLVKDYTNEKYSSEYRDLQVELSELEAELAYQKLSLQADMLTEYYSLSMLQDKIKLEELNLEIQKINYDSTAARAKLGLVDAVTEINVSISFNRQKVNLQSAMYDYIIAAEQFNERLIIKK